MYEQTRAGPVSEEIYMRRELYPDDDAETKESIAGFHELREDLFTKFHRHR